MFNAEKAARKLAALAQMAPEADIKIGAVPNPISAGKEGPVTQRTNKRAARRQHLFIALGGAQASLCALYIAIALSGNATGAGAVAVTAAMVAVWAIAVWFDEGGK